MCSARSRLLRPPFTLEPAIVRLCAVVTDGARASTRSQWASNEHRGRRINKSSGRANPPVTRDQPGMSDLPIVWTSICRILSDERVHYWRSLPPARSRPPRRHSRRQTQLSVSGSIRTAASRSGPARAMAICAAGWSGPMTKPSPMPAMEAFQASSEPNCCKTVRLQDQHCGTARCSCPTRAGASVQRSSPRGRRR